MLPLSKEKEYFLNFICWTTWIIMMHDCMRNHVWNELVEKIHQRHWMNLSSSSSNHINYPKLYANLYDVREKKRLWRIGMCLEIGASCFLATVSLYMERFFLFAFLFLCDDPFFNLTPFIINGREHTQKNNTNNQRKHLLTSKHSWNRLTGLPTMGACLFSMLHIHCVITIANLQNNDTGNEIRAKNGDKHLVKKRTEQNRTKRAHVNPVKHSVLFVFALRNRVALYIRSVHLSFGS